MSDHSYLHLQAILERLKLSRVSDDLDRLAEEAARDHWSYVAFLEHVLEGEVSSRTERDVTMKTRLARFPFVKTLEQFDFSFQPALNEAQIRELAAARFVASAREHFVAGSARRWEHSSSDQPGDRCHHAGDQRRLLYGGRSRGPARARCERRSAQAAPGGSLQTETADPG